jgi:hypothetical protein
MEKEMVKIANMYIEELADSIEIKYQIPKRELKLFWHKMKQKKLKTQSQKESLYQKQLETSFLLLEKEPIPGDLETPEEVELWKTFQKLKVYHLRDMCERFGLETSVNRQDMIKVLVQHRLSSKEN